MDSAEVRKLAEENLGHILKRSAENSGRISQDDLAAGSFFCRVAEAETTGSPYAGAGIVNWNGALERAASVVATGS